MFIYGYIALDIWLRITQIKRADTHCYHLMGHYFELAARDLFISTILQTGFKIHSTGWSEKQLERSTKRVDLMSHHPMSSRSSTSNIMLPHRVKT